MSRSSVVITGASTGIGRDAALRMAGAGWRVFAGVRNDEAARRLQEAHPEIVPLELDVTRHETIDAAVNRVTEALGDGGGLAGLVNNAGIAVGGPLEVLPLAVVRHQFEVNVFGQVAVIQAFLPQLRRARGRIVNVSSIAGKIAMSFVGPYCASKHALEAISDALRHELEPWDIRVSLIEPGSIATPIWDKARDGQQSIASLLDDRTRELYGAKLLVAKARVERATRHASPVSLVSDAIEHALTAPKPKIRYLVGSDAKRAALLRWLLPDRMFDSLLAKSDPKPSKEPLA